MFNFRLYPNMTKAIIPNKINLSTTSFANSFYNMTNLIHAEVPNEKITNMSRMYYNCTNLTDAPVCGSRVTNMRSAYCNCTKLTGSPVCGDAVTNMQFTYQGCTNLTGAGACGNKVTQMYKTYEGCTNLTGPAIVGENVSSIVDAYNGCINLAGNAYIYSTNLHTNSIGHCFEGRNTSSRLNIYLPMNSTTATSFAYNSDPEITPSVPGGATQGFGVIHIVNPVTWTTNSEGYYYNTEYNIYVYPVENVAVARAANGD